MDHYSKCNICGEMVKNMRQHEKHKHRGNQKASLAMLINDGCRHKPTNTRKDLHSFDFRSDVSYATVGRTRRKR